MKNAKEIYRIVNDRIWPKGRVAGPASTISGMANTKRRAGKRA